MEDKYIVVSGGSGGLGRATVKYFADNGYKVFSLDIKCTNERQDNITQIQTDLTSLQSIQNAFNEISKITNKLFAVISLAGIYFMDSMIEVPEEELKNIFDINFFGVYRLNKIFLPLILNGKGRVIITTSELAGMKALPFNGIYSATKTVLQHYTDSLRQELSLLGIKVVEIMPGAFDTGMIVASFKSLDKVINKTQLYKTNTKRFKKIMESQSTSAKPPIKLAQTIYKATLSKRPRTRYKPNANILLKLFNIFPRSFQVYVISKIIKG